MTRTHDRLKDALLSPDRIEWIRAETLLGDRSLSCIDGRHDTCTVAAPGGNAGELMLLLAVAEWFRGAPYTPELVHRLLTRIIADTGRLYIHTDEHAVSRLAATLGFEREYLLEHIADPPLEARARLLAAMTLPEHLGCGHLEAMARSPAAYRVRPRLLEHVVRAMMRRAWSGRGVDLTVLRGAHREQAIVVFHSPQKTTGDTLLPIVSGAEVPHFFSGNVPALRFVRRHAVESLLDADVALSAADGDALLLEVERLGERQLDLTVQRLAPDAPRYRATFRSDRRISFDFVDPDLVDTDLPAQSASAS